MLQMERIQLILDEAGMKAADLARAINKAGAIFGIKITEQAINQWLLGSTKKIKGETLFVIESATGYSARWIALGDGPKLASKSGGALSEEEHNLVEAYRSAPTNQRNAIEVVAGLVVIPRPEPVSELVTHAKKLRIR